MKKTVLCVIAHPDDEAFGPSGTLAKLARTYTVHIACVTDGDADPRFHEVGGMTLAQTRARELAASAETLGAVGVHFLHFQDGSLNNNVYHEVAGKIQKLVDELNPSLLVTTELRGVSGHLDHVAVAMATSFVYRNTESVDAILYHCTNKPTSDSMSGYFIYFPPGFERDQVDLVVDISDVFDKKLAAARCHASQQTDVDRTTKRWMSLPKEEWFLMQSRLGEPIQIQ